MNSFIIDEETAQKALVIGSFHVPDTELTHDLLALYLFKDFSSSSLEKVLTEEKYNLISNLFSYDTLENIEPYVKILAWLPFEFLKLMVDDQLYFILSDYTPRNKGDNREY